MEKLLFPADIAERYRCTLPTARSYIRRMEHQEKPLAVTETALISWEQARTVASRTDETKKTRYRTYKPAPTEFHVPRKRPA